MSNFLIFKANFNRFADPAIGTYTVGGGNPQFIQKLTLSPDYYMYVKTAENPVKWFVPTAAVTDFEFVCDILTRDSNAGYAPYFTIADSNGVTKLRMESQYSNIRFMSDDTHGQSSSVICLTNPTNIGGYGKFHQFRIRVRKLTDSSSSVAVYVNDNLVTSGTSPALITCGKISFLGAAGAFVTDNIGVKNAYVYDLSGGEVIDRSTLSNAFTRFIGWAKGIFALKSDIQTVNDGTLTIQQNGTNVQTFTANASTNKTANITVPTKTSDLTNDSGFITSDATKIPLAGSNQISGDLIPSTDGTVNLGGVSYQWNNLYAKNYYYNGTAWGLDKQNEWTNFQRMISNPAVWYLRNNTVTLGTAPSSNRYIGMFFEDVNGADLGYVSFQANKNSYNSIMFSLRNYDGTNAYTGALRYRASTTGAYCFFPETSECDLGISTNKWKTLNGINPGALSLPGASVNVDTTDWVLDGSNVNIFIPASDGWFGIQATDTVYDQMHYVFVGRTGGGNTYYQQNLMSPINALWDNKYHGCIFIPVIKNMSYHIRCICDNIVARFYPCQGNV